jgi:hypothetical protein
MTDLNKQEAGNKAEVTLLGKVEKIIRPINPDEPEKAQINVEGADDLYREIRIDNVLENEKGETVRLKQGAEVEVKVEADADAITKSIDQRGPAPNHHR